MTQKANTSSVVHRLSSGVLCIPTISPPPGGNWDFTFRLASEGINGTLPERFFLCWNSGEDVGLSNR